MYSELYSTIHNFIVRENEICYNHDKSIKLMTFVGTG